MSPAFIPASVLALRAASLVCPSLPTCPDNNGCTFTANGADFQVSCATDFYGGDMGRAYAATVTDCMTICASADGCTALSYVGKDCYMKNKLNGGRTNQAVIGANIVTRVTPTPTPSSSAAPQQACPTTINCPDNNGCLASDSSSGRSFTLACGVDFYGGDLKTVWTDGLEACSTACAGNAQCVAASFVGNGGSNGPCYLKSKNQGKVLDSRVNGFSVNSPVSSSSSSLISTFATPSSSPSLSLSISSSVAFSTSSVASSSSSVASSSLTTPSSTPLSSLASSSSSSTSSPSSSASATPSPSAAISSSSTLSSTPVATPTPTTPVYTNNIVRNPSFEADTSDWNYAPNSFGSITTSDSVSGSRSFLIDGAVPAGGYNWQYLLEQTLDVRPGIAYTFQFNAIASNPAACYLNVNFANQEFGGFSIGSTWKTYSQAIPAGYTNGKLKALLSFNPYCRQTGKLWIDSVSVIPVTVAPVAEPPLPSPIVNMIAEPSFEDTTASTPWKWTSSATEASGVGVVAVNPHDGTKSFQFQASTTIGSGQMWTASLQQTFAVVPGTTYNISFWVQNSSPAGAANVAVYFGATGTQYLAQANPGETYKQYVAAYTVGDITQATLKVTFFSSAFSNQAVRKVWLDDFTVVPVSLKGYATV